MSSRSESMKRFLTRAEALTLLGMAVVVFSLFLTWVERHPMAELPPALRAIQPTYIAPTISQTGFSLPTPIKLGLIVSATLASATLLAPATRKNGLAVFQGACGLVCLTLSLRYSAFLAGNILGILGSACIVYAAFERHLESRGL